MTTLGMKHIGWTPEHDTELRACMARGLSFREAGAALAKQFGIVRSRNACIGRAARIGLTSMLTPADGARMPRPSRRKAERVIVASKNVVAFRPKPEPRPPSFQAQMLALRSAASRSSRCTCRCSNWNRANAATRSATGRSRFAGSRSSAGVRIAAPTPRSRSTRPGATAGG